MEDFTSEFQKVLKPSDSFSELNSNNMEMLNNFSELNQPLISSHVHGILDYFSSEISSNNNNPNTCNPLYSNQLQFSSSAGASDTDHQSLFGPFDQTSAHVAQSLPSVEGNLKMPMSEIMEILSSPGFGIEDNTNEGYSNGYGSGTENDNSPKFKVDLSVGTLSSTQTGTFRGWETTTGVGGRKRKRKTEGGDEKQPREVIHVRAKRGQATDSHSLAERVRRERINEKLRLLQDLVPGCYKTMGMAVMLDVIINYVRSLQNQIEFLSMKLSAASFFYDFNSPEAEALETLQQRTTNPYDVHEMEKIASEEYKGMPSLVHSTWSF